MNTRSILTKSARSLLALVTLSTATDAATITWNTSGPWDVNATANVDTVQIATTAGSRVVISLATDDAITNLNGVGGSGSGAVYQTAGNLVVSQAFADSNFSLGGIASGAAGYGFYGISGGSLQSAKISAGGRSVGAIGVLDISGGTVTATEKLAVARGFGASSTTEAASYGLINITGGTVTTNTVSTAVPSIEMGYNANSFGVFNVGGGVGTATVIGLNSATAGGLDLGNQVNAGTTIANLLPGGTLTVSRVYTSSATVGTQLLNFNGGTLKATALNFAGNFLTDADIDAVTVYSGGGTIDNSGTGITIGRALTGATGSGITTIAVTDGGSGYVGAPIVHITGGAGTGATAIANMVDDGTGNGTFRIGSISITSPGTFTDVTGVGVTLQGGGALTPATVGTISTAANVSGGMTFMGSSTTTVTAVNTYTGKTTINAGTLQVGASERIADASVVEINNAAKLQVQSFTETIRGLTTATPAQAALVQHSEAGGAGTGTLIIDTAGNDYTFNGILRNANTGGGVLAIQKSGAGTQTFNYTGTAAFINFTGGLTVNGGTLKLSDSGNGRTIGSFASNVTNNATFVLENTGANNQTFGRAISGSGNVILSSPNAGGSLTLSAANTYSGSTTINGGTVTLSPAGSIANSSGVLLNSGALLGQGSLTNVTVANAAANAIANTSGASFTMGTLTFNGAATLNLAYAGTPAIAVTGALTNTPANGQVVVNGSSITWVNGLNNLISFGTFGGSINGFTKGTFTGLSGRQFAESLQVSGNNIALNVIGDNVLWTGANGGIWRQYAQNTPTSATPAWELQQGGTPTDFWVADNAIFDDSADGFTDVTITGGSITANSITFNNGVRDYSIGTDDGSGIAAGTVIKNGGGSLTVSTANTYAGGTTLNAGTLILNNMSAIGTGMLTINGGTLDSFSGGVLTTNNAQTWNGDFTFGGGNNLDMGGGQVTLGGSGNRAVTVASGTFGVGEIKSAGTQGLTKQGPGTLVVNSAGVAGAGSVIGGTLNVTAGTLQINKFGTSGVTSGDFMAAGLTGGGTVTNGANDERWLMINGAGSTSFSGKLENGGLGALGLAKLGVGTLAVTSTANTYTGQTVIEGGVLNVATFGGYGEASSIGAREAAQDVATNVGLLFRGGTLQYTGSTPQSTNRQIRIGLAGGAIDASGSNPDATLTFTHTGTNADLFETGGARTLTLTGSNTGANTFGITLTNQDVSPTGLLKSGVGKWVLTAAHTYTGTTTAREGTLVLAGNRTAPSGGITVGDAAGRNATLEILDGNFNMGANVFIVSNQANSSTVNHTGGAITMGGTQMIVGNNFAGSVGTYNLSGGTLTGAASTTRGVILGTNGSTTGIFNLSGTGNFALGGSALQVGRSDDGNSTNSTGIFNQTGGTAAVGTLTIGGGTGTTNNAGTSGTLNLTGGTFSAATFTLLAAATNSTANITIGGTAHATLPAFPTLRGTGATANLTFDGGTLSPTASSAAYLGGLTNAFVTANGAKFDVASGNDITVSQPLVDASGQAGTLTKLGAGALTLSGTNSYTGTTTVNAGPLLVNGSISGSAIVNGGGVIGGTGLLGAVTVNPGGSIAPGNGVGTLTAGALTMNEAATFELQFNIASSNSVTSDLLNATSLNLALNNSSILALANAGSNLTLDAGTALTFLDYSGAWNGGTFANLADDSTFVLGANEFRISYDGVNNNDSAVVLVAVPEPGAAALLLGGLCSMLGFRRTRRRS